jgi:hypothetical protein
VFSRYSLEVVPKARGSSEGQEVPINPVSALPNPLGGRLGNPYLEVVPGRTCSWRVSVVHQSDRELQIPLFPGAVLAFSVHFCAFSGVEGLCIKVLGRSSRFQDQEASVVGPESTCDRQVSTGRCRFIYVTDYRD